MHTHTQKYVHMCVRVFLQVCLKILFIVFVMRNFNLSALLGE